MAATAESVPCPECGGTGELVMSDLVAGYWGYERVETSYSCSACDGTGKLSDDEADLLGIAASTEALLKNEALDPAATVSNLRTMGTVQAIDIVTARGDRLTFAVDRATNLPAWRPPVKPSLTPRRPGSAPESCG